MSLYGGGERVSPSSIDLIGERDRAAESSLTLALIGAIVGAEFVLVFVHAFFGAVLHTIILAVLLSVYVRAPGSEFASSALGLSLVPVLRLLSFGMAVPDVPYTIWPVLVGTPLAAATLLVHRCVRQPKLHGIGIDRSARATGVWLARATVVGAGAVLAVLATFTIERSLLPLGTSAEIASAVVSLILFVAVLEEVVFRGLIQRLLTPLFGIAAVAVSTTIYASTYLGVLSAGYLVVMTAFGVIAGWHVYRYGSLVGPIAGHIAVSVGPLVIWPLLSA